MTGVIDTDKFSSALRARSIDVQRRFLITRFAGSDQEGDLTEPVNCEGYGRIRHFHRATNAPWPNNPLPIDPAASRLGIKSPDIIRAQVFQNASCNWRCWYCYVPFELLAADESRAGWFNADDLVAMYAETDDRPPVLDLSGGQPDLVPEWIPDTMRALRKRNLQDSTYLWSDDNLSTDYLWRYLTRDDLNLMREFLNYGRVACFKGFDESSFAYNTNAHPSLFALQFELFERLLGLRIDTYAYVTFTGLDFDRRSMSNFMDRLQGISEGLPLRTIPLEITSYGVVRERVGDVDLRPLAVQREAVQTWNEEIERRFSPSERATAMNDVRLEP